MALQIDSSGILLLQQVGSDVQYSIDGSASWLDISAGQWPVTLNNTDTANTLEVQFTTDLSFNSADQYFILDSSNITVDGSNHIVNIDLSGAGYPGLFQNGTYYYNGTNIDASNNAYSNITIQNIIIDSHSSSLLAIALQTTTQPNETKYGNGWLCQAYFGLNGSTNSIDNCSSNGGTNTVYWVASNGDVSNNNTGTTQGGCILGDFCSADVTNCYSTGTINDYAGGIFGQSSQGSATNCYSIGTIDSNAGGIFGPGSLAGANATNCYSTGTIGVRAGGIFGTGSKTGSTATNCYSTGTIGNNAGGIFGSFSLAGANATNCYSIGTMGSLAGGIFGQSSQGSATNCYSSGTINNLAGGIFGQFSSGSATNCYCTGGTNIGGSGTKNDCYAIDGSANWLDASANDALDVSGTIVWTDIDTNSTNVPYRLSSFNLNQTLYDPSSGTNVVTENPDLSGNYTWSITSVNGSTSGQAGISIDPATGDISFATLSAASYAVNVLAEDSFGNYSYETFTNIISNICFPAGTPIVTNQGIIAINKINPAIHTIRNKKIVAITKTVSPDKYLVRFEKDALGANLPCEATTMTKNHMLFYKGEMMKAKEFLKTHNESVSKVPYKGTVLYNVLMEEHDKMVVNNLICETLHPENYVAQMYRAFRSLTPKQRVEAIKQVNTEIVRRDIFSTFGKSGAKNGDKYRIQLTL